MTDSIDPAITPPESKVAAAMDYLDHGFAVIALGSEAATCIAPKSPHWRLGKGWSYREGGDRPFVGTRDPRDVEQWWRAAPASNLGVITGAPSGLLVIDCDRHGRQTPVVGTETSVRWGDLWSGQDGVTTFAEWARDAGIDLSTVPCVETGGGGLHYYWSTTSPPTKWTGWLDGVDVMGTGGYVVAPPSRGYRWRTGLEHLSEAPSGLLAAVNGPRAVSTSNHLGEVATGSSGLPSNDWFLTYGLGAYTGSRDQDAYRLAWRLLNGPEEAMIAVLYRAWQAAEDKDHPFTWDDVMKCVESARRRVAAERAALRWEAGGVL